MSLRSSATRPSSARRSSRSSSSRPRSSASLNTMSSTPDCVSLSSRMRAEQGRAHLADGGAHRMAELAVQVPEDAGLASVRVVGDADLARRAPAACRSACPATARPATSPFTSARNTGTPIREKPSASVISVTVLPVPVAPATRPWRLPYFGSSTTWPPCGRGDGLADEDGVHARSVPWSERRFYRRMREAHRRRIHAMRSANRHRQRLLVAARAHGATLRLPLAVRCRRCNSLVSLAWRIAPIACAVRRCSPSSTDAAALSRRDQAERRRAQPAHGRRRAALSRGAGEDRQQRSRRHSRERCRAGGHGGRHRRLHASRRAARCRRCSPPTSAC